MQSPKQSSRLSPGADAPTDRDVQRHFWKTKSLSQMTEAEWEALCDGCGRCCLFVLKDTATRQVHYTRVACPFMNTTTCRCKVYTRRHERQPLCNILTPENLDSLDCLPATCAYKRVARQQDLEWWHPLISGNRGTVHLAGISIIGKVVSGGSVSTDQLTHYLIRDDEWNR